MGFRYFQVWQRRHCVRLEGFVSDKWGGGWCGVVGLGVFDFYSALVLAARWKICILLIEPIVLRSSLRFTPSILQIQSDHGWTSHVLDYDGNSAFLWSSGEIAAWYHKALQVWYGSGPGIIGSTCLDLLVLSPHLSDLRFCVNPSPDLRFTRFVAMVEAGYNDCIYHNGLHAADVTHALHCLLDCQVDVKPISLHLIPVS